MDMRMPVMSGLEALQVLSRQEQLPPTIILTTFDDDQLVLAGLKAGAKGYLLRTSPWHSWSVPSAPWPTGIAGAAGGNPAPAVRPGAHAQ